jgi:hypothetical protein
MTYLREAGLADREAIRASIKNLVYEGHILLGAEMVAQSPREEREKLARALSEVKKDVWPDGGGDKKADIDAAFQRLVRRPDFNSEYQSWYSPALRVVQQLLPDRHSEFCELYKASRRKEIDVETYGIADYIAGIHITQYDGKEVFNSRSVALGKFNQQIAIVQTAEARLDSVLTDISRTLRAEILDNELGAARNLLEASHIRSAGVVAGVVLEGHLKKLIEDHGVTFRKMPMLGNLNDALKQAGVYDAAQWREIQYLADVRNLCGHKKQREPERNEVESLINGVAKITKTLF